MNKTKQGMGIFFQVEWNLLEVAESEESSIFTSEAKIVNDFFYGFGFLPTHLRKLKIEITISVES